MKLRSYQDTAVKTISKMLRAGQNPLLVSPTGSGKSVMLAHSILAAKKRGMAVAVTAHRDILLSQLESQCRKLGIKQLEKGTPQTLLNSNNNWDVVFVDEAHRTMAASYIDLAKRSERVVGATATPWRLDGKSLLKEHGGVYDDMYIAAQPSELMGTSIMDFNDGGGEIYEAPIESLASMAGLETEDGEYDEVAIAKWLRAHPALFQEPIAAYGKYANGKTGIGFFPTVGAAEQAAELFNRVYSDDGFRAAVLSGKSPPHDRKMYLEQLEQGKIQFIASAALLVEGVDIPNLGFISFCCPTRSLRTWMQACGRVARPARGKTQAIILDHVGACITLGDPFADRTKQEWIDGTKKTRTGKGRRMERQAVDYTRKTLEVVQTELKEQRKFDRAKIKFEQCIDRTQRGHLLWRDYDSQDFAKFTSTWLARKLGNKGAKVSSWHAAFFFAGRPIPGYKLTAGCEFSQCRNPECAVPWEAFSKPGHRTTKGRIGKFKSEPKTKNTPYYRAKASEYRARKAAKAEKKQA